MHPVARVVQGLLIVTGFVLLIVGWVEEGDARAERRIKLEWVCGPDSGSQERQRCVSAGPENYSWANGAENTGLAISLAGVGMMVAAVAVGQPGRTRPAAAPAAAAAVPTAGSPFPAPPAGQHQGFGTGPQAPAGQPHAGRAQAPPSGY